MTTTRSLLPILLLASSTLSAQLVAPPAAGTAFGGARGGAPFTYGNYIRFQQAIDSKYLKPGLIYGISFRSRTATTTLQERQWQGMRVILADLAANSVAGMGSSYNGNLGKNQAQVFDGRFNMYRPYPSGVGNGLEFSVTIPFDKPYLHMGTAPLVVDLMPNKDGTELFPGCQGGGNGLTMDYSRDTGLRSMVGKGNCGVGPSTGTPAAGGFVIQFHYAPLLMQYGKACQGSLKAAPQISSSGASNLGAAFTFELSGGSTTGKTSVLLIGLSNTVGVLGKLPFDISGLGLTPAGNCWQNSSADITVFLSMVQGKSLLPTVIPNVASAKGSLVFCQFACDDPGIAGFSTTQGGVIRLN